MKTALALIIGLSLFSGFSYAEDKCMTTAYGQRICPPPQGGIQRDGYGEVLCGLGQCKKNRDGEILCSDVHEGLIIEQISDGELICVGGNCVKGSESLCRR